MEEDNNITLDHPHSERLALAAAVGIVNLVLAMKNGALLDGLADQLAATAATLKPGMDDAMREVFRGWADALRSCRTDDGCSHYPSVSESVH